MFNVKLFDVMIADPVACWVEGFGSAVLPVHQQRELPESI